MSVVAVKLYPDKITIAADSIIIKDDLKRTNFKKLYKFGDLIVAGCGSAEELCLFFEFAKREEPASIDIQGIQDYMTKFSDMLETCLGDKKINNDYIIIYKGRVFEVEGMFVQEVTNYTAIGEGEPYALSALYLGHTAKDAVRAACKFSCFVSEPIVVEDIPRKLEKKLEKLIENIKSN